MRSLRHQALHQPPSASASALLLTKSGCDGDAEPRGAVHACEQCEAGWKAMHTLRCELHEHKEQLQGKTQALSEAVHKIAELEDKASQVEAVKSELEAQRLRHSEKQREQLEKISHERAKISQEMHSAFKELTARQHKLDLCKRLVIILDAQRSADLRLLARDRNAEIEEEVLQRERDAEALRLKLGFPPGPRVQTQHRHLVPPLDDASTSSGQSSSAGAPFCAHAAQPRPPLKSIVKGGRAARRAAGIEAPAGGVCGQQAEQGGIGGGEGRRVMFAVEEEESLDDEKMAAHFQVAQTAVQSEPSLDDVALAELMPADRSQGVHVASDSPFNELADKSMACATRDRAAFEREVLGLAMQHQHPGLQLEPSLDDVVLAQHLPPSPPGTASEADTVSL